MGHPRDKILSYAMRGVSSRNYSELLDDIVGGTGLSKSTVSRAFNKSSRKSLESLNGRDLSKNKFSAIMIDGVVFGSRTVVVSLGITDEGKKLVLGLREGHTENWEVCKDLLESLIARGLCEAKPYLFVIDGSRSLRKAIDRVFGSRTVVVSLGITDEGKKLVLGLREGHTENWEVCKDLLESLIARGLCEAKPYLFVIDGSRSLRKAIDRVFGSRTVVVSLGITDEGKKLVLGLREGHTENWEVCKDLLESLIARGLCEAKPYLFVIDGSRSLRKAIDRVFGERAAVQRCIHHKERNVLSYLPQERHLEFKRRWKMLHGFNDYSSSQREYNNLLSWLSRINHAAFTSLKEAGMETLTTIKLKVSPLLRRTLSSTNPIESAFSIVRDKVSRVKNWRSSADQVMRWAAVSLVEAEKKFRAIKGYKDLNTLEENLKLLTNNKNKRNQTLSSA